MHTARSASPLTEVPVTSAADGGGGGQQGQFAPGPQCKGAPKQC